MKFPEVHLVWDGVSEEFRTPPPDLVGEPPPDRFTGSAADNLAELAGRVCYSSVDKNKKGRPSAEYHANIHEVKHYSVYAHQVHVVHVARAGMRAVMVGPGDRLALLAAFSGRPGVWPVRLTENGLVAAVSLRAVLGWFGDTSSGGRVWEHGLRPDAGYERSRRDECDLLRVTSDTVGIHLARLFLGKAPLAGGPLEAAASRVGEYALQSQVRKDETDHQWCSVFVRGVSRGLLDELVRHHYQANPSVRSTRYCDEYESPVVPAPLMARGADDPLPVFGHADASWRSAYKYYYDRAVAAGLSHKEARGVARTFLPMGVETQAVFSASALQWRWLLSMRDHPAAEPEIRRLARALKDREVLPEWVTKA